MNQKRLTATLILTISCLVQVLIVSGQAVKINIQVKSTVAMQQLMPFETMPANSMQAMDGTSIRPRATNAMGAFTITGKENTDVLISLDAPNVLVNKENQTTPYQMKFSWQDKISGDVNSMKWSNSNENVFKLTRSLNGVDDKKKQEDDSMGFLYLIGYADAPANAASPFEGNVKLTIEY